jgi:hypothetical protein
MNEIAVIRRSADESLASLDAVRAAFPHVVDVHRWDQVQVERVDSNGQVTAYLAGKAIDELRAVFQLAVPHHGNPTPSREQIYVQQEREQALAAALACCRHVKIVNRAIALAWNRAIYEGPGQLRLLAKIGWATPSVTHSYDLLGDTVAKLREPDPEPAAQDLLVIGLRRHARANRGAPATPALAALVARTQLFLREAALDLCTIPIAHTAAGPVAFGLHAGVTAEIARDELIHLLREAIA